jgi:hypothetical protein
MGLTCEVLSHLYHNGVDYKPGDAIVLEEKHAASLMALGVVAEIPPEGQPKPDIVSDLKADVPPAAADKKPVKGAKKPDAAAG